MRQANVTPYVHRLPNARDTRIPKIIAATTIVLMVALKQ